MSHHEHRTENDASWSSRMEEGRGSKPPRQASSGGRRLGAVVVLILLSSILTYQLLIPPVIGLADQGDYGRVFQRFGIDTDIADYSHRYFGHFIRTWKVDQKKAIRNGFLSPDVPLVGVSLALNTLLSKTGLYDIRCLALVRMAIFLAAAALILQLAWRHGLLVRAVAVFAFLLVFADVGYVAYFNSGYSEPSSFLFGLLTIAFYLRLVASEGNPWANLSGLASCAALLVWSKPQNILLGFVAGVAVLRLARAYRTPRWRVGTRLAAIGLMGCSILCRIVPPPDWYRDFVRYIAVFTNVLPFSPDPQEDLQELGLDPSLAKFAGTLPWDKEPRESQKQLRQLFYSRIGDGALARFYLHHPGRIWTLLKASAPEGLWLRTGLGNFEESTGLARFSYAQSFALRSNFARRHGPNHLGWFAAWLGAVLCLAAAFWLRARAPARRLACEGIAWLVVAALSQYATVAILQGPHGTQKQMFLFAFLFDCCLMATLALVAHRVDGTLKRWKERHGPQVKTSEPTAQVLG